jgi:hypothetical protein
MTGTACAVAEKNGLAEGALSGLLSGRCAVARGDAR